MVRNRCIVVGNASDVVMTRIQVTNNEGVMAVRRKRRRQVPEGTWREN